MVNIVEQDIGDRKAFEVVLTSSCFHVIDICIVLTKASVIYPIKVQKTFRAIALFEIFDLNSPVKLLRSVTIFEVPLTLEGQTEINALSTIII